MTLRAARERLLAELRDRPTLRARYELELVDGLLQRARDGDGGWTYSDEPDPDGWADRDFTKDRCRACGRERGSVETEHGPEFPDPCLGLLPGVGYACCGHGRTGEAVYVNSLTGPAAARRMRELGGDPPAAAFRLDPATGPDMKRTDGT
jgi:hypothetical protein